MPLFVGDLPDYPTRYVALSVDIAAVDGSGGRSVAVSVAFEDGRSQTAVPATTTAFPVEPWEFEAISSRLVVKQSVPSSSRDLDNPAAELGSRLFEAIFSDRVVNLYASAVDKARRGSSGLCVRFHTDRAMSAVPWELIFDRTVYREFLALAGGTSIVRTIADKREWPGPISGTPRVMLVTADPDGMQGTEQDVSLLEGLEKTDQVRLTVLRNPSSREMLNAVAQGGFDILHIAGHAAVSSDGRQSLLMVADPEKRTIESLPPGQLMRAVSASQPVATILAVCRSDLLARSLGEEVPVCIGIRGDVSVPVCSAFLHGFYGKAVQGVPVAAAVAAGRDQIVFQQPGDSSWAAFAAYTDGLGPLVSAITPSSPAESEPAPRRTPAKRAKELSRLTVAERNLAALEQQWGPVGDAMPEFIKQQRRDLTTRVADERQALGDDPRG